MHKLLPALREPGFCGHDQKATVHRIAENPTGAFFVSGSQLCGGTSGRRGNELKQWFVESGIDPDLRILRSRRRLLKKIAIHSKPASRYPISISAGTYFDGRHFIAGESARLVGANGCDR